MHIEDIRRSGLREIEAAFRAIVGFPGEDDLDGVSDLPDFMAALDAVCAALANDDSIMPSGTFEIVRDMADGELSGSTYADGASAVQGSRDRWRRHLAALLTS